MHVYLAKLHFIFDIIIYNSAGIDTLNPYSPVGVSIINLNYTIIHYMYYNEYIMYIVLLISICYCFMHNHALSPFPTLSPLLYHDSFSIIVYRFMYSIFCYLLTSLYCLISCEFLVFYICLAHVRYYFYHYLPYFDNG